MPDIVDLNKVLLRRLADVVRLQLYLFEACDVEFPKVGFGAAGDQQFRHGLGHPRRMGNPDRLGQEESAQLPRFAHQRAAVGRERKDAVEPVRNLRRLQRWQQPLGFLPRRLEILGGEGEPGRHRLRRDAFGIRRGQLRQVDRHRPVGVGTDPEPVTEFAEIQVLILVPQNRQAGMAAGADSLRSRVGDPGQRCGFHVLMGQGQQRNRHANQIADGGTPETCGGNNDVGTEGFVAGAHPGDTAGVGINTRHGGATDKPCPARFSPRLQELDGEQRRGQPVRRNVQGTQDVVAVHERMQFDGFVRIEEAGLESPGGGEAMPAF